MRGSLRQVPGPGLPAIAGRGVAGASGSSRLLPIRGPCKPDLAALAKSLTDHASRRGRGIGTRSGLDAGGRLRTIRAFLSDATTATSTIGPTVSRASRPARSRSEAAASAGWMQRRRVRADSSRCSGTSLR